MPESSARLLIVDDEAPLMRALCETLETKGYSTLGFTSASAALAALREESFDVVLTDLMMPEMDGISVLNEAFKIDPNLVGIVMTGHGSVNTAVDALKTGAVDYILKPFKLSAILPVLTRALSARRLRMENVELREAIGLHELSIAIAFARDSEAVLQKVADAAFVQSRARALSVLLFSEPGTASSPQRSDEGLYVAAVRGTGMEHFAGMRLPLSLGLQQWAAKLHELSGDLGVLLLQDELGGLPRGVSVPMQYGGTLVGILHFEPVSANRPFTMGQQKALSILAGTGAAALAAAFGVERLRAAEARYRRLAEDAPDVVARFEMQPVLHCSYVNPAIEGVSGYRPEEFYADSELMINVAHPDDRALARRTLQAELPKAPAVTLRWLHRNGAVSWVEQRSALVHNRRGELVAIEMVCRDITERRNLEEQLRHSQRLEAIGKLTAGVAHDFNNLLTIINGYCALALSEVAPTAATWRKLDEIKKAGDQAANMTNRLLAFSRKQATQPRVVNLSNVLREMEQMIARIVGDSVHVSTTILQEANPVRIDPTQAQQVILNLAVNARDAMSGSGKLDFEIAELAWHEARALVPDIAPGTYVLFAVSDTGSGMTPEVKERIFEPFFTTKEVGRGTGLGLATVRGIVEQSGGSIRIDSRPGLGTRFSILLPRSSDASEALRVESTAFSAGHGTVLLVEDDAGVRSLSTEVLTSAGYVVLAAGDGPAAVSLAERHANQINLLVTDMNLPGISGATVAEKVRRLVPNVRVLFTSGSMDLASSTLDVKSLAEAEFLEKPFTPAGLSKKVHVILNA
ncbi:response regulator [uncultured Paludibaculum sp.]|uniref:response regulator n=1 Tax=uncultured Paludibaculum sp. TaxID=1765020 RepID=UPI002AABCE3D|nr:response regulator [uncultured Paludibaculum sp.]